MTGQDGISDNFDQEAGNYNVLCQSCGKILGINVESQELAFRLEEEHTENTRCKYTGSHIIRSQKDENPTQNQGKDRENII